MYDRYTSAQTVVDYSTFEQKVLDYSQTLKQSVAQRTAMQKAMKAAKTAFFPAVDATGSYQYRINKYEMDFGGMAVPMEHDSYSAEVGVSQPIYAGGSIYHNYKASQIQTQMADKSVDLTTDNIIYAAEASYWGTAAQKEMYETMCQYVQIIEQLTKVLQDKVNCVLLRELISTLSCSTLVNCSTISGTYWHIVRPFLFAAVQ